MKNKKPSQTQGLPVNQTDSPNGDVDVMPPYQPAPNNQRPPQTTKKSRSLPIVGIIILGLIVLIGLVVAYILMIHIPNRPENIYRRGLGSVGVGLEKFADQPLADDFKATNYKGHLKVSYPDVFDGLRQELNSNLQTANILDQCIGKKQDNQDSANLTFSGSLNLPENNSLQIPEGSLNLQVSANDKEIFDIEARSVMADNTVLPYYYFNLKKTACAELLRDTFLEELTGSQTLEASFDQWYVLDLEEFMGDEFVLAWLELSADTAEGLESTQADYEELQQIFLETLKTYIFTSDPDQMIFQMDALLDGKASYKQTASHKFSTTINRANMIAMIEQMRDQLLDSKVYEKTMESLGALAPSKQELKEALNRQFIEEYVDSFIKNYEVQIWVDSKTKILRNMRFIYKDLDSELFGSYIDLGLLLENRSRAITLEMQFTLVGDCNLHKSSYNQAKCSYRLEDLDCSQVANQQDCIKADVRATSVEGKTIIASLKPDAQPLSVAIAFKVDTDTNMSEIKINFKTLLLDKELAVEFLFEAVDLNDEVTIDIPANAKPWDTPNPVLALQINQRNAGRANDRAYIRNQYLQAVTDNGGRRPTVAQINLWRDDLNWIGTGDTTARGRLSLNDDNAMIGFDQSVGDTDVRYNTFASTSNPGDLGIGHYVDFDSPNALVLITGVRCVGTITSNNGEIANSDITTDGANRNSLTMFYLNEGNDQIFCSDDTN